MKKEQIKELLECNIARVIIRENKERETHEYDYRYNYDAFYCVLTHLRDYLIERGVRVFRLYIKSFDGVKIYKDISNYNLLTHTQEITLSGIVHNLKQVTK